MKNIKLEDIIKCPKCNNYNVKINFVDPISFYLDGTGCVNVNYHCECGNVFDLSIDFNFQVTDYNYK